MTEDEWLTCTEPRRLIQFACGRFRHSLFEFAYGLGLRAPNLAERGYRRFACACLRRVWHRLSGPEGRAAVEVAERFAEGRAGLDELFAARARIEALASPGWAGRLVRRAVREVGVESLFNRGGIAVTERFARFAASKAADEAAELLAADAPPDDPHPGTVLSDLFRDIFGNPFRPVTFRREWRTDTAVALAAQMYESRDFGAMPILADALQDAGCDNPDVLDHCRGEGPHVRGCWVVDRVLGKE